MPRTPDTRKFDRKKMNPNTSREDSKLFKRLRNKGFTRACALRQAMEDGFKGAPPNKFYQLRSTAFEKAHWLIGYGKRKNRTFVDAGAGQSPDAAIALMEGYENAFKLDLFPSGHGLPWYKNVRQVQTDLCESIPLRDNSVDLMVCQAVISLMKPKDRFAFYKEVKRVVKNRGHISFYFCDLINGYAFNIPEERKALEKLGFGLYRNYSSGFIMQRVK